MVKAGARTYFFDIFETNQGKDFLVITESRYLGEGKERIRKSLTIFPETAAEFGKATAKFIAKLEASGVSAETEEPTPVGETEAGARE